MRGVQKILSHHPYIRWPCSGGWRGARYWSSTVVSGCLGIMFSYPVKGREHKGALSGGMQDLERDKGTRATAVFFVVGETSGNSHRASPTAVMTDGDRPEPP